MLLEVLKRLSPFLMLNNDLSDEISATTSGFYQLGYTRVIEVHHSVNGIDMQLASETRSSAKEEMLYCN